jgi:hypothetical protein
MSVQDHYGRENISANESAGLFQAVKKPVSQ